MSKQPNEGPCPTSLANDDEDFNEPLGAPACNLDEGCESCQ